MEKHRTFNTYSSQFLQYSSASQVDSNAGPSYRQVWWWSAFHTRLSRPISTEPSCSSRSLHEETSSCRLQSCQITNQTKSIQNFIIGEKEMRKLTTYLEPRFFRQNRLTMWARHCHHYRQTIDDRPSNIGVNTRWGCSPCSLPISNRSWRLSDPFRLSTADLQHNSETTRNPIFVNGQEKEQTEPSNLPPKLGLSRIS